MKYYALFLDVEESNDPRKAGIAYAIRNKERWVPVDNVKDEFNTYDKGTTVFYYNEIAYNVHKDYVNVNEEYRVYICKNLNLSSDTDECLKSLYPDEFITKEETSKEK